MFRYILPLLLIVSVESPAQPLPQGQDELTDALDHARALYYEANFDESIQLLSRVDDVLRPRTDRMQDKIAVKLQLALAHIGLNENSRARSYLRELYELDADYPLDPQQFSPKVIALAEEARAEQNETRCKTVRDNASRQLETRNVAVLVTLLDSMKTKCAGLTEMEPATAELLYKTGLDSYKKGDFVDALQKFRAVVRLSPQHEMASQYIDLTESKVQVAADRLFLSWTRNFEEKQYQLAADDYRQLMSLKDPRSAGMLNQARDQYRQTVSEMVEASNRACANSDTATVTAMRNQLSTMLPDTSIAEDIVKGLAACTKKDCLPMNSQLILARLKTRVDPEIPASLQTFLRRAPVTVRVQARVDEKGDVIVGDAQGANPALNVAIRNAVERWKFTPVLDADGPRCVDTEIPVVITP
jgi:hypothetical protein